VAITALTLLFSWERAKAQTLGTLAQYCERLENVWRQNPPESNKYFIPNDAGAATCYGYLAAISGLSALVITLSREECAKGFGPNCRHALSICFPTDVSFQQVLAVFLAYARSHAPQWHETGWHHVRSAMVQAFPCKGEYIE
jgi:hypothetical protein